MTKIIINGRAGSGKDVIADYLVDKYGFIKITFATPIYAIAREYFDMIMKDRTLLQAIGQKMREIDPDVWIKAAFKEAEKHENVVISDCRQFNEYLYAIRNNFTPIRVRADLDKRIERCIKRDNIYPKIEEWENDSETGADFVVYSAEIENNGTIDELYEDIDELIKQIKM